MKTLHCSALVWPSPVGPLTLVEENEALTGLHFGALPPAGAKTNPHPLLREAVRQLEEYFEGQRKEFDLPLAARGTPFQLRVWAALRQIPQASGQRSANRQPEGRRSGITRRPRIYRCSGSRTSPRDAIRPKAIRACSAYRDISESPGRRPTGIRKRPPSSP